jgi:serine/threonine protein kinase
VNLDPSTSLIPCLVLFSVDDQNWKITDLQQASWLASSKAVPGRSSLQKPSYRAPESVSVSGFQVSSGDKLDMWLLGCIVFQLITGKPRFRECDAQYESSSTHAKTNDSELDALLSIYGVYELLSFSSHQRPSADEYQRKLEVGSVSSTKMTPNESVRRLAARLRCTCK